MIVFEKTSLHNTFVMTNKRYHITMSHNIFYYAESWIRTSHHTSYFAE